MQQLRFCFFIILIFLTPVDARAGESTFAQVVQSKTIRCGYFNWPPYITKDPNTGQLSGINYDVMQAVGKNLSLKVKWVAEIGVGEVVAALSAHKFDVMCASVWPDPARMANLTLTNPTFFSAVHAFSRPDDRRFDGHLEQANQKNVTFSVMEGDVGQYLVAERFPLAKMAALPQSASGAEVLMQVISKKADLVLVDRAMVNDFLKTNPGAVREVKNIPPVRVFGEHLAVAQGEYQLKNIIDLALGQLVNDGVIQSITDHYARQYRSEFYAPKNTVADIVKE